MAPPEMPRSIRYHPLFETDVIDAAAWYDARNPMIGTTFVDEVSRAVDQLTQHPERRSVVAPASKPREEPPAQRFHRPVPTAPAGCHWRNLQWQPTRAMAPSGV